MNLTTRTLSGSAITDHLDDLASLRLEIFAEFPYLYQGKREDEISYLSGYAKTPGAIVILAEADGRVVGAATGMPLIHEDAALRDPVTTAGLSIETFYYVGELLFYPAWRGAGMGLQLLSKMEEEIHTLGGYDQIICATVERPDDHPARPAGHISITRFLARTGFSRIEGATTGFTWLEPDGIKRDHPMLLWSKPLAPLRA